MRSVYDLALVQQTGLQITVQNISPDTSGNTTVINPSTSHVELTVAYPIHKKLFALQETKTMLAAGRYQKLLTLCTGTQTDSITSHTLLIPIEGTANSRHTRYPSNCLKLVKPPTSDDATVLFITIAAIYWMGSIYVSCRVIHTGGCYRDGERTIVRFGSTQESVRQLEELLDQMLVEGTISAPADLPTTPTDPKSILDPPTLPQTARVIWWSDAMGMGMALLPDGSETTIRRKNLLPQGRGVVPTLFAGELISYTDKVSTTMSSHPHELAEVVTTS